MTTSISRSRVFLSLLLVLGSVMAGMNPAAAEIGNNNNLPDGVVGLATGTQTDSIDTKVWAIEQIGSRIYVGGRFLQVTAGNTVVNQPYLAAFDSITGQYIPSFAPTLDNSVYTLQASPDGSKLFVGGDFDTVNGSPIDALVALDPVTGAVDNSWTGDVNGAPVVRGFDVEGDWLYVGGSFTSVISSAGNNAAWRALRFNVHTGAHDPSWRPVVTGGSVWGIAASPDADRVYLAGYFSSVNGSAVAGGFAPLMASTPSLVAGAPSLPFNTANTNRRYLYDVVVGNGFVWVAGSEHFVQVLNESDLSLERFHLADPRGDYQDLEIVGDRVYASCHCRADAIMKSAEGVIWFPSPPAGETDAPILAQGPTTWVAAFDAITGDWIPSFVPDATSAKAGIWAIHGDQNGCLWFGGDITSSSGSAVDNLIRLCEAGTIDTERPSVPGAAQVLGVGVDSVDLVWAASTDNVGVAGYRLFDAVTDAVIVEVPGAGATVSGLAVGSYSVYVKAFDAAGNQSYRSGIRSFTVTGAVVDIERPSVPGAPAIQSIDSGTVSLSWTPATDNVGVAGYRVFDYATSLILVQVAGPSGTVTGLAPGTYQLYVKAFDAAGNQSYRSGLRTVVID
ncbi:MAG: fibronectin type III domain-containing protein [Acidimicrobiales bacterium]|nr:fibronectin type III domain-containing protein [Acidimicrobiales bacterium]